MPKFLFVPSTVRGNGSGHLVRCLSWVREFDGIPGSSAALFLPGKGAPEFRTRSEIEKAFPDRLKGLRVVDAAEKADGWDFLVLDQRTVSRGEEERWRSLAPTIALDEGGPAFQSASFCVDTLPRPEYSAVRGADANLRSAGFLDLPERRREAPPERIERVLLTFGGEDPGELGPRTARALVAAGLFRPEALTLVRGALHEGSAAIPEGVRVLEALPDLKESLVSWDLVITQFGLTAFEAAWARCAVILVNPGSYHSALARRAGFARAGEGEPDAKAFASLLEAPSRLASLAPGTLPDRRESLPRRLAALGTGSSGVCPACGAAGREALARYPGKSYFRCSGCGLIYRELFAGRVNPYREAYFFEEYRKQYGRTYLEDLPALKAFAARRLDILERLLPHRSKGRHPTVLDVGCAYGAFLAEATDRGWDARGTDVADTAAAYVREELGLPAEAGDFQDPSFRSRLDSPVDCLSLWYVLEHFDRLGGVLAAAASMVRPGGIFAFSTPSGSGVSARKDPAEFFERSPDDHVSVWEPRRTPGILRRWGFRVERLRVTGHHPERFPGLLGRPGCEPLAGAASRILGLGDTFECYARRMKDDGPWEAT